MARDSHDPRLDERFVREVPHPTGHDVVLVGVVHDHPASVFRAETTVSAHDPDTVALELPPLAVPLFESYARAEREPSPGGEMTAAIRAAPDAHHVGIDALDHRFVRTLLGRARSEDASLATISSLSRKALAFSRTAVRCRVAALFEREPPLNAPGRGHHQYDCEPTDSPAVQAERERAHVSRCMALSQAIETPPAVGLTDETREACMASRLDSLRERGDVVAIVGIAHLEPIADRLLSDC